MSNTTSTSATPASEGPAEGRVPRRIVTGHDADGASVVLSDGPVPVQRFIAPAGVTFYEVWQTDDTPAPIDATEAAEPTDRPMQVPPGPRGTKIQINEFLPGHLDDLGRQAPMHRTQTIDYGLVLEGELVLILPDQEVPLRAGDVVVQRGTDHAWANRSDAPARIAFVLIDAEFTPDLVDRLPEGAMASLTTGGPDH